MKGTLNENAQELGERVRDALKESNVGQARVELLKNGVVEVLPVECIQYIDAKGKSWFSKSNIKEE